MDGGDEIRQPLREIRDHISGVIPQLRTTDLGGSIRFYTEQLGLTLEFRYEDFYAGIRAGHQVFHLKLVDQPDPSIDFVDRGESLPPLLRDATMPRPTRRCWPRRGVSLVTGGARDALGDARVRHQGRSGPYSLLRSTAEDRAGIAHEGPDLPRAEHRGAGEPDPRPWSVRPPRDRPGRDRRGEGRPRAHPPAVAGARADVSGRPRSRSRRISSSRPVDRDRAARLHALRQPLLRTRTWPSRARSSWWPCGTSRAGEELTIDWATTDDLRRGDAVPVREPALPRYRHRQGLDEAGAAGEVSGMVLLVPPAQDRRGLTMSQPPEHVRRNEAFWDERAHEYAPYGEREWAREEPVWGVWNVPESQLGLLPESLAGQDAIELGCGTAYVSAWLARRGARVVGVDVSEAQLATARRLQQMHGLEFPLLHGNAESVPYPDASFDFAISEYGACLWADPHRWVPGGRAPAAARWPAGVPHQRLPAHALRAGRGRTSPATDRLLRPAFGMFRVEWPGDHRRRVPPLARRLDSHPAPLGIRDRGPDRRAPVPHLDDALALRHPGVGAAVALRRGVEGAQARMRPPW